MGENKIIVRRLVSGILLILFALLAFAGFKYGCVFEDGN